MATVVQQVGGHWTLVDNGQSRAIHSREPQREADRQAAGLLDAGSTPTLIVAIGLGLGYLLDALDRRGWNGKVLALEPEPGTVAPLRARAEVQAWTGDGRLRVLAGPDFAGASDCWSLFGDGADEPAVFINHALGRVKPVEVARAQALALRLRNEARSNAEARRRLGGRYLLNTLRNLRSIATEGDVSSLDGIATGMACVVVAAGPSLDRALPALREVQGRALIICVDTALRALLAAGINPHLVVAADPSEVNARHLTELPGCPETCLVAEGSIDPIALPAFRGRTFFFTVADHHPWPWLRSHGRSVGTLRAWGSVLTIAFDLALRMGCDRVAFAGADLSFTGNRPYCRGVAFEEDWRRRAEWGQPIEEEWAHWIDQHQRIAEVDVAGRPARTAPHLVAFRNWLLEQMRRETGRRFFNATGAGILHGDGITQVSPDALPQLLGDGRVPPVRGAYGEGDAPGVLSAARAELAGARTIDEWLASVPGVTRDRILDALRSALATPREPQPPIGTPPPTVVHPQVGVVGEWLGQLASTLHLVPMRLPLERLVDRAGTGTNAHVFFFRTTVARIILSVLQMPDGALTEDGHPLQEAASVNHVVPGTYRVCRDELHFMSSDGSDPRWNGRNYAILVPQCLAELETMPRQQILDRGL